MEAARGSSERASSHPVVPAVHPGARQGQQRKPPLYEQAGSATRGPPVKLRAETTSASETTAIIGSRIITFAARMEKPWPQTPGADVSGLRILPATERKHSSQNWVSSSFGTIVIERPSPVCWSSSVA